MTTLMQRWLDELTEAGALVGGREATAARLEGWLPWLEAAVAGDDDGRAELLRVVAFDAHHLAHAGRPASVAVTQPLLLAKAWPDADFALEPLSHLLVRVAADAFALGASEAHRLEQRTLLERHLPVVPIGDAWVGYLIGPLEPEVIDGLLGRLLPAAAGRGALEVAIDLAGAEPPNPVFLRTLEGFAGTNTGSIRRMTVTGVADPAGLRRALEGSGVPPERVAVGDLREWLAARQRALNER